MAAEPSHRFCVAPMLDVTDRHYRHLLRLLSRHAFLYSEMITAAALARGDAARLLRQSPASGAVALQLGGAEPAALAAAAALAAEHGYREVNLNVGCPSSRVQGGRFGACLMAEPARVAECVAAMQAATALPVTVKTRLGIDALDSDAHLQGFIAAIAAAGCRLVIVHARKAWLQGLSPRQNREIPPLQYERVYRLQAQFPQLAIVINGGIADLDAAEALLAQPPALAGAMLGRAVQRDPYLLAGVDRRCYGEMAPPPSRLAVARHYLPYVEAERSAGTPMSVLMAPLLNLFQGQPGARRFRRHLSERGHRPGAGPQTLTEALAYLAPA